MKKNSRFWNISGVNVKAGISGVDLSMDSLASVVMGGVAFDSPDNDEPAEQGQSYALYPDYKSAKRGVNIQILVPMDEGLKLQETGIFHKNVQVGVLTDLDIPVEMTAFLNNYSLSKKRNAQRRVIN